MIQKIAIRNYRLFREFDLEFSKGTNILVGGNDTGKSTVLEAINLALTGRVHGRALLYELTPYFINLEATRNYIDQLRAGANPTPPQMIIDVFLDISSETEILRGSNNLYGEDTCGVRVQAEFSQDYSEEYRSFISEPELVQLVPTEYYKVEWLGFSGNTITKRSIPEIVSLVDSTSVSLHSGIDYHMQRIIHTCLDPKERVELSRQYRTLREEFSEKESVKEINKRLQSDESDLVDRKLSLAIDISQRYTWESSLVAHLDNLPFQQIGKGDQTALKTVLAIGRKADDAHVVLLEEPEIHLSHTSLRKLINRIEQQCSGKQVIIATHSNYVLNKLVV